MTVVTQKLLPSAKIVAKKKGVHICTILFDRDPSIKINTIPIIIPITRFPIKGNFFNIGVYSISRGSTINNEIILPIGKIYVDEIIPIINKIIIVNVAAIILSFPEGKILSGLFILSICISNISFKIFAPPQ